MNPIKIINDDITQLKVDAVVNAAKNSLLGGGGVDGAIHAAAGPELLQECRTLGGCETGQSKLTKAYNLPAKYIIHTVGPVWEDGQANEAELLASCYRTAMELAELNFIYSIAFPAISCGIYGYPIEKAAKVAIETLIEYSTDSQITEINLVCFDQDIKDIYTECLENILDNL